MTTRTAIRQQNAERRLRHATWAPEPAAPISAGWVMFCLAVAATVIVPLIMRTA